MLCNKLIHCESARFQIFVTRSTLLLSSLFGTLQYERERIFKSGPQHFQCEICKQIWSVRYIGLPSIFIMKNFFSSKYYFVCAGPIHAKSTNRDRRQVTAFV